MSGTATLTKSWTYFIQATEGGPIKIGFTTRDPSHRLKDLMVGSPVPLQIVGLLPGNAEKKLHKQFSNCRSHGEWFEPTDDLVQFINKNARSQEDLPAGHKRVLSLNPVRVLDTSKKAVGLIGMNENKHLFDPEQAPFGRVPFIPFRRDPFEKRAAGLQPDSHAPTDAGSVESQEGRV